MKYLLNTLIFIILVGDILAQPTYIFNGGIGDGYGLIAISETSDIYNGNVDDGHASLLLLSDTTLFNGGIEDGYASNHTFSDTSFYNGGAEDGYASIFNSSDTSIYNGSDGQGYAHILSILTDDNMYNGNIEDGYAFDKFCQIMTWTGSIGSGWNVAGNWNNNQIPCNCNSVVIPANSITYPGVNAGVLKIGYQLDNGDYNAKEVLIRSGAELTTRINCKVENYGLIRIKGTLYVRNPSADGWTNHPSSRIEINSGGAMKIEGN
ncbi:MAG: hypothetical protein HKN68_21880 [Saprospiraceae bacterium]|nr:hypothetical protein [Saprospiraceae bacterium]